MEEIDVKKPSNTGNYILIALLIIVIIVGIYLAFVNMEQKKQLSELHVLKEQVELEKKDIMKNLEMLSLGYDSLMTDNDSVNAELEKEKMRVEELLKKVKSNDWEIYKLKKEASTLREIMKGYVRTIDSLNTLNIELTAENIKYRTQLSEQQEVNQDLSRQNEELAGKVKIGAALKARNIFSVAQFVKKNKTHKETRKASKAQKIKTCFTLEKNPITEPGKKVLYLRIVSPTGQVLADKADDRHMFEFEGNKGLFSVRKIINYDNKEVDVCMYWDVNTELVPGVYNVSLYSDGILAGSTSFELK